MNTIKISKKCFDNIIKAYLSRTINIRAHKCNSYPIHKVWILNSNMVSFLKKKMTKFYTNYHDKQIKNYLFTSTIWMMKNMSVQVWKYVQYFTLRKKPIYRKRVHLLYVDHFNQQQNGENKNLLQIKNLTQWQKRHCSGYYGRQRVLICIWCLVDECAYHKKAACTAWTQHYLHWMR